jgi:hypothetical protein
MWKKMGNYSHCHVFSQRIFHVSWICPINFEAYSQRFAMVQRLFVPRQWFFAEVCLMGWPSNCFISLRQGSSSVQRNGSKWQVAEENDGKDRFICFWMIFGGFLEDLRVLHFCTNLDGRVWLPRMTGVFSAKPGGWPANPPETFDLIETTGSEDVWSISTCLPCSSIFLHVQLQFTMQFTIFHHDIPWLLRGFRWFQTSIFHDSSSLRSLPCQSLPLGLLLPSMRRVQSAVAGVTPKISQVNFFIRGWTLANFGR